MPMPQDFTFTWEDGTTTEVHIPLVMMRGHRRWATVKRWAKIGLGGPQLRVGVAHRWKAIDVGRT